MNKLLQQKNPLMNIGIAAQHEEKLRPPKFRMSSRLGDETGQPPWNSLRCGVSKGVEDDRKAVSGVARLQGIEGLGMAGPIDTLEIP
jgi:hypothetical protein